MLTSLPEPGFGRWTPLRKRAVVSAILRGELTAEDAVARYALSPEELVLWVRHYRRHGTVGLYASLRHK